MKIYSLEEAKNRYGEIINGSWANEAQWMNIVKIPDDVANVWINFLTKQPTKKIYINKDATQPLLDALNNIKSRNLLSELRTFSGCFIIRDVRGMPGHPSTHSYGLAIDIRADDMPLGSKSLFSDGFVKCFTDAGWTWGGTFSRLDPQHFSYAWE